jgi:hypothetical protein
MATPNAEFLAKMEDVLGVYEKPYDPKRPVICIDERPCFLIGDQVAPLPMSLNNPIYKEHYAYQKHGSCTLFIAVEPLSGKRLGRIYKRRCMKDYADFMNRLHEQYPAAEHLIVVQDNLNTHKTGSFYQSFEAEKARTLTERFEFHFTPVKASWLNMAELELSAISRQALHWRIPSQPQLEHWVEAVIKERNEQEIKINWQFTSADARQKLNRHYANVLPENLKYK